MRKLILLLVLYLLTLACSKSDDNTPLAQEKYTVSVSASIGGSVSTAGGQYNENTSVSITAIPEEGFEFSGWTGTSLTGNPISIKVTSNQTINANFIRSIYTLTVNTVGNGEVTQQVINSGRKTEEYESGKTIRLTATPQSDFLFYDWEYPQNNTKENSYENPLEVEMDGSKTVTATFEVKLPIIDPDNTDKNNTVGKWKIRKKGPGTKRLSSKASDCEVNEIIFRSNNTFTIITETSTITGRYTIENENTISLYQGITNIGILTELILTESFLTFNIVLTGVCDEQLEADRDLTYDEATDPLANTSGSSTAELESSTLDIEPCTIKTTITSNNADQTISLGDSIQNITIDVTIGSTCTETLSVSSSNLPEGVTVSLDNDQITIEGTPSSNSVASFDYEIILNLADPEVILNGTITIENITTTEANSNQGENGTDNTVSTSTDLGTATSATDNSINSGQTFLEIYDGTSWKFDDPPAILTFSNGTYFWNQYLDQNETSSADNEGEAFECLQLKEGTNDLSGVELIYNILINEPNELFYEVVLEGERIQQTKITPFGENLIFTSEDDNETSTLRSSNESYFDYCN